MNPDLFPAAHPWQVVATPNGLGFHAGRDVVPVKVTTLTALPYIEMTNGRCGVRVAKPPAIVAGAGPPVVGVRHADGTWVSTATGSYHPFWAVGPYPEYAHIPPKTMTTRVVSNSPLRAVVEVLYTFDRPDLWYGEDLLVPAGPGFHRTTIELQADQPSLLFTEDGDMDLSYTINLHAGLGPTRAQYRGHSASAVRFGRESSGGVYRPVHERGEVDATIDLSYAAPVEASYQADDSGAVHGRPPLALWDPWSVDTGRTWLLSGDGPRVVGVFAGPASKLLGCASAGPAVVNGPGPYAGVEVYLRRRDATGKVFPRNRFSWGLFLGDRAADLNHPDAYDTPVGRQMNLHAGMSRTKLSAVKADWTDPPGGYGAPFLPPAVAQHIRDRVRTDNAYYQWLYDAEPTMREELELWRDPAQAAAWGAQRAGQIVAEITGLVNEWVNGNGYWGHGFGYVNGGQVLTRLVQDADAALAATQGALDREKVKAAVALCGTVLFDNDFAPWQPGVGVSYGTVNMPQQHEGYRGLAALTMGADPTWKARATAAAAAARDNLKGQLVPSGAHFGVPHYLPASAAPNVITLLRAKRLGVDHWGDPLLAKFGAFYLNLLTPPETRFGGVRKMFCFGNGSTEASSLLGVLATGFRGKNDPLARRLQQAWVRHGKPHDGFFGSTVRMIDDEAPGAPLALASVDYDGYGSVLRARFDTPDECAVWLLHGDHLFDHRHYDHGQLSAYLMGEPIALDWGPQHEHKLEAALHHNVCFPEALAGTAWDADDLPARVEAQWASSRRVSSSYAASNDHRIVSSYTSGGFLWQRTVRLLLLASDAPVLAVNDEMAPSDPYLLTWNLMGNLAGMSVPSRTAPELPTGGVALDAGDGKKWTFSGQRSVDFDLYLFTGSAVEARAASWGHDWHPGREQDEYRAANGGAAFEERQTTLRFRGAGPFLTVIVPYRTGTQPQVKVQRKPSGAVVATKAAAEVEL